MCCAHKLGCRVQGQGHNQGSEVKSSICNNLKPTEANFFKLYKLEGMSHNNQCQGHSLGSEVKLCLRNYSEKYKGNVIAIRSQIRHHKRVCHAQDTGSHTQGQSHSQRLKVKLFNYVPVNTLTLLKCFCMS